VKEVSKTLQSKNRAADSDKAVLLEERPGSDLDPTGADYSALPPLRPGGTLRGYSPPQVLSLQRMVGNKAVQRMVERTRQSRVAARTGSTYSKAGSALVAAPANQQSHPVQRLLTLA
jgi:hypothetical protein